MGEKYKITTKKAKFDLWWELEQKGLFIKQKIVDKMSEKKVENYLNNLTDALEPRTHCCECTPGKHFQTHMVHIQYPDCTCDPKDYVLKRN